VAPQSDLTFTQQAIDTTKQNIIIQNRINPIIPPPYNNPLLTITTPYGHCG